MDAVSGYIACFGTYTVDEEALTVTHHREGALSFNEVDYVRRFEFQDGGDRLVLTPADRPGLNIVGERIDRERYWSPTVLIRGAMALVWAPYEFQVDGATSHCGVDMFSFAKIDGVWKVSNSIWTVEPNACAELRPDDASTIRPGNERGRPRDSGS